MESVALYSFQATEKDELPFQKGDTLKVWGAGGSPAMGGLTAAAFGGQSVLTALGNTSAFIAAGFVASLRLSVEYKEPSLRFWGCGAASPAAVGTACLCHQPHLQRSQLG